MRSFAAKSAPIQKPKKCFYKLLNVSASAEIEEIKSQYYKLAKKYHPDALTGKSEEEIESSKDLFKEITEAYAIVSDPEMRKKYDRLLFGDSADSKDFENQDAYQYWSSKSDDSAKPKDRMQFEYQEMQDRVRQKLKTFKDYDDFLRNFENHREKHEARAHLMREEGFKDLNEKYVGHDQETIFLEANDKYKHKYNTYKGLETYYEGYWDTKANHLYYSQPVSIRAWLQIKKVSTFYYDMFLLWGFLGFGCMTYNASSNAKNMNVTAAMNVIKSSQKNNAK